MKKILFGALVLGLFAIGIETNAQGFGVRAGYQVAYTNNNGNQVGGSLAHYYLGAFHNKKLGVGDLLTLHTGLEYMQNGHRTNDANFLRMNMISVPVALRIKLGPLFAQGGFNGNFKISENYQVNGLDALNSTNKTNSFDLPAHIGLGLKFFILEIEARYHQGFLDVNNGNKNSYFQLGLAVGI
jgi:hypothetical protein